MRCITFNDGVLELNWMWLPTFIGQNYLIMKELQEEWKKTFGGGILSTPMVLDQIHRWTLNWICEKFPIEGLRDYLVGIEKVPQEGNDVSVSANAV